LAAGLALLQTASNPYVSIIGPIESAATRISIMGICNKVAGILAGIIFGSIALKDAGVLEERLKTMDLSEKETLLNELAGRVVTPYMNNRRRSGVAGHCYPFFVITGDP